MTPSLSHALWLLALIKLVTPPLLRVPVELQQESSMPTEVGIAAPAAIIDPIGQEYAPVTSNRETGAPRNAISAKIVLFGIWIAGTSAWVALAGIRGSRFSSLIKRAPAASGGDQRTLKTISLKLNLKAAPRLVLVDSAVPPLLWFFSAQPTIAIPSKLWETLTREERETLLAHELAHYRRRDHWYRWIECLVVAVFWWHPLVWLARREIRKAEEASCDAWVAWAFPKAVKEYANALMKTIDFLAEHPSRLPVNACGCADDRQFTKVKDRLTLILNRQPSHRMNKIQKTLIVTIAAVALPLSGYFMQSQAVAQETAGAGSLDESESRAFEARVMERLDRLERLVHSLVVRERENSLPMKAETRAPTPLDLEMRAQQRLESHRLQKRQLEIHLERARLEAELGYEGKEAELDRRKAQLELAQKQFDEGRIHEQELLAIKHEARLAEIDLERHKIFETSRLQELELQLEHHSLMLNRMDPARDPDTRYPE